VEWEKRWKVFPNRFFTAFAKYHVITLLMRTYEYMASLRYDKVVLDKLTMDPFFASRQLASSKSTDKSSSSESTSIAKEMFYTTFWGNLIAFMADYTVHQVILCYGYYVYIRRKRQQASSSKQAGEEPVVVVDAVIMTSLLRKSTQLFVSRSFGLVCSAVGGAVGTLWWPGWGTMLLSNMGEGAAAVVMDDGLASTHNRHHEGE
jgi:amino acid permease